MSGAEDIVKTWCINCSGEADHDTDGHDFWRHASYADARRACLDRLEGHDIYRTVLIHKAADAFTTEEWLFNAAHLALQVMGPDDLFTGQALIDALNGYLDEWEADHVEP